MAGYESVPTTATSTSRQNQRITVDKKTFEDIYSHLQCSFHYFVLNEGTFNDSVPFKNNCITFTYCPVANHVNTLFKGIKGKRSPGESSDGTGDRVEKDDKIDTNSSEFEKLLASLNSCLEDENVEIIEKFVNENHPLNVTEDQLIVGLGKHLIRKLTGSAVTSTSKSVKKCPCTDKPGAKDNPDTEEELVREPELECGSQEVCREVKLYNGDMYIGSSETWHGELDLLALGAGGTLVKVIPCTETDADGDSQGDITNLDQNLEQLVSQAIMQAITFGWTEYNHHQNLSPLIPTVYMNNFEFSFIVYNPVSDSLFGPVNFMKLINTAMDKNDVNRYLGIFLLWLILNHRFFFVKHLKVEEKVCRFQTKAANALEHYKKLNTFSHSVKRKCKNMFGHVNVFVSKRKR